MMSILYKKKSYYSQFILPFAKLEPKTHTPKTNQTSQVETDQHIHSSTKLCKMVTTITSCKLWQSYIYKYIRQWMGLTSFKFLRLLKLVLHARLNSGKTLVECQ